MTSTSRGVAITGRGVLSPLGCDWQTFAAAVREGKTPEGARLTGSASEWCAGWYDESRGLRRANFGNWAAGKPDRFHLWAATGWPPDVGNGDIGFRLVVERR